MKIKRMISLLLVLTLCFSCTGYSVFAQNRLLTKPMNGMAIKISDYLTEDDLLFVKKLEKIYPYFIFDENGGLSLSKNVEDLQEEFNLTDDFVSRLNNLLNSDIAKSGSRYYDAITDQSFGEDLDDTIRPNVFVRNWKVYFTHDEVMATLFAAAQIGPAAIVAALAALGTSIGGPVGAVIGTIVGYISGAGFAYLVLRAGTSGKGVYIGLEWDGPFPVYVDGTW